MKNASKSSINDCKELGFPIFMGACMQDFLACARTRPSSNQMHFAYTPRAQNRALVWERMMINHSTLVYHVTNFNTFSRWL